MQLRHFLDKQLGAFQAYSATGPRLLLVLRPLPQCTHSALRSCLALTCCQRMFHIISSESCILTSQSKLLRDSPLLDVLNIQHITQEWHLHFATKAAKTLIIAQLIQANITFSPPTKLLKSLWRVTTSDGKQHRLSIRKDLKFYQARTACTPLKACCSEADHCQLYICLVINKFLQVMPDQVRIACAPFNPSC